jgi:type I restriction enzyme S subunit
MSSLFDPTIIQGEPYYFAVRDREDYRIQREICESLWVQFEPFADPEFNSDFPFHFPSRFWEMYLGNVLLNLGHQLIAKSSGLGPDLHFKLKQRDIWIEAVVPTKGEGNDAVPDFANHNRFEPLPEDEIILRFTNSIHAKHQQHQKYISEGLVGPNDLFIVALNGCQIPFAEFFGGIPIIIKSVLPIGQEVVTIDTELLKVVDDRHLYRGTIVKKSGSEVSTRGFLDDEYKAISGIIYSNNAAWNFPSTLGADLLFFHNPSSNNQISMGWLECGLEYWVEGDQIFGKRN